MTINMSQDNLSRANLCRAKILIATAAVVAAGVFGGGPAHAASVTSENWGTRPDVLNRVLVMKPDQPAGHKTKTNADETGSAKTTKVKLPKVTCKQTTRKHTITLTCTGSTTRR